MKLAVAAETAKHGFVSTPVIVVLVEPHRNARKHRERDRKREHSAVSNVAAASLTIFAMFFLIASSPHGRQSPLSIHERKRDR